MPLYPALALLLGCGHGHRRQMDPGGHPSSLRLVACWRRGRLSAFCHAVRHVPTPGDISVALSYNPERLHAFARVRWKI